ncbi:MAG: iron-containing alcohol dehydrogenase [Actinomycetota bacterium]
MSAGRTLPRLTTGVGVTASAVSSVIGERRSLMIVDARAPMPALLSAPGGVIRVDGVDPATVARLALHIRRRSPEVVVAVGGGSVIDAVKLASLAIAPGDLLGYVMGRAESSALTFLPPGRAGVDIIAVPTTPGTSTETNAVAVLTADRGHRLVVGEQLRPRHAVLDGEALLSLPTSAMREGCAEALLRVAGASTSSRSAPRARAHAEALGAALVRAGDGRLDSPESRLRVARLSAATQRSAALRGRDPYAALHWYVANEVSFRLGVRKVVATTPLMAPLWSRIGAGDRRWGDREGLGSFWSEVARSSGLAVSPHQGIAALLTRWGIDAPPFPGADVLRTIAAEAHHAWQVPLRIPRRLTRADVLHLLEDSRWGVGLSAPTGARPRDSRIAVESERG